MSTATVPLSVAIAKARARIEDHLTTRPSPYDIPARTVWAQAHHELQVHLHMLEDQAKSGWSGGALPESQPVPQDEEVVQMTHLLERLERQSQRIAAATTRADYCRLRQAAYWMREEAKRYSHKHHLPITKPFPPIPADPWKT